MSHVIDLVKSTAALQEDLTDRTLVGAIDAVIGELRKLPHSWEIANMWALASVLRTRCTVADADIEEVDELRDSLLMEDLKKYAARNNYLLLV